MKTLQTLIAEFQDKLLNRSQPLVMGILNTTPDSFSDGGSHTKLDIAVAAAQRMMDEGADIIDIGGESTRPGAPEVSVEDELNRVIPLVKKCKELGIPVSVDTMKTQVMAACLDVGVVMLNDVNGFRAEGAMELFEYLPEVELQPYVCIMHMQGVPRTMQHKPEYKNLFEDINQFFKERVELLEGTALEASRIVLDPGFGFGKTDEHNWSMLREFNRFNELGYPVLSGLSRKSMFGRLLNKEPMDRIPASLAGALISAQNGARIIRVHDVAATVDVLKVLDAVKTAP